MPSTLHRLASKLFGAAGKEQEMIRDTHAEVEATLKRVEAIDPGVRALLDRAHGYAVFPSVGKATAVIGGAYGRGEVFERGKLVGYAALAQLTLGVQLGGQTFSEIIAFETPQVMERFKAGKTAFAANASAVLVKAGAAAARGFEKGAAAFVYSEGGMMLEAAIGAQKFIFRPAVLGRGKDAAEPKKARDNKKASSKAKGTSSKRQPGKRTRPTSRKSAPSRNDRAVRDRARAGARARSTSAGRRRRAGAATRARAVR
jgi:lipid-binding SYLF domain-containing protein